VAGVYRTCKHGNHLHPGTKSQASRENPFAAYVFDIKELRNHASNHQALPLIISAAFSATEYIVACKCAAGMTGRMLASTMLSLLVP
jgi:hypothetical protein